MTDGSVEQNTIHVNSKLEAIIAHGNRGHWAKRAPGDSLVTCADGFTVSIIAGGGTYCHPRPALCACWIPGGGGPLFMDPVGDDAPHDCPGPYTAVEVGFPAERPEPWDEWERYVEDADHPTDTVYGYVPVDMVRELIAAHGGEVEQERDE